MVDGAGHYPHLEYPDVVAGAVVGFITESMEAQDGEARRN
jgi:pimeloyl-ACP methyl ester carboxylesterase